MVAIAQVSKGLFLPSYPMKPEGAMKVFGPDEHVQPGQGEGRTDEAVARLSQPHP